MSSIDTEIIYADLFALVQTVVGTDWDGNPLPIQTSTRNYKPPLSIAPGQMPYLQQLELPEERVRKALGMSTRKLHALVELVYQTQDNYPDNRPLCMVLNSFVKGMDQIFGATLGDAPTMSQENFHGNIIDVYFTKITIGDGVIVKPAFVRWYVEIFTDP